LQGAWDSGVFEAGRRGSQALKTALIEEVKHRAFCKRSRRPSRGLDLRAFTKAKVEPMVRGLFPARERELML
jgi:hypothetical protein